ncbi:copper resistance protein CopC [Aquabacterium sp. CECT 9606]|uniref:copper resistance CopC family protein n=1 Tax=Aquabacterium sp. CECT 9606 TaxID=2845822 RepID=UPI001E3E7762|nr:copper resistance protein CopC [Aquabacterium sp. CECT 9606]
MIVFIRQIVRSSVGLTVLSVALCPSIAMAHAGMISSEPGRRAVLTMVPKEIRLCFNEDVEASFSTVTIEDAKGKLVPLSVPAKDPKKPSCIYVPLPLLSNGAYTVKYRVLSVDGHVVEYGYGFRLNAHEKAVD